MKRNEVLALAAVGVWLSIVGWEIWLHASAATEPPVWDALTYSLKSKAFWDAVGYGKAFNPFALDPTVRPPGVVLVGYPFGFSESYAGFYFRSNFIPALLLALSALVVGWATRTVGGSPLVVAGATVCIAGLPTIFQFQAVFDRIPSAGYWGLVDNFITGVAALAAASLVAASMRKSWAWAAVAAGLAGFCLWIKPAGLLIMACILFSWACVVWREIARDRRLNAWIVGSLVAFLVTYAVAGGTAFFSPYFSHANMEFGSRVMEVSRSESHWSFSVSLFAERLHVGTGWGVVAIIVLGLVLAAMRREQRWAVPAAGVALASGLWFWLFAVGDVGQVRYFLPFALMAAVLVLPAVIDSVSARGAIIQGVLACMVSLPALASAVLAAGPPANLSYQRLLGINLTSNAFPAEGRLASDVLDDARSRGIRRPKIFVCSLSAPLRNFSAVVNYGLAIGNTDTKGSILLPVDWTRGFAFRLDEVLSADYIACDRAAGTDRPIDGCAVEGKSVTGKCAIDSSDRASGAGKPVEVSSYDEEYRVVRKWLATLGAESGIEVVSTENMNLLQIADKGRFESALSDFASKYSWRRITVDGYSARWWTGAELAAESKQAPVGALNIGFRDRNGKLVQSVRGLRVRTSGRDAIVDVWLEPGPDPDLIAMEGFRLFCHIEDRNGAFVAHGEVRVSQIVRSGQLRQYRLLLSDAMGPDAKSVGLGMYGPGKAGATDPDQLRSESPGMDWGGRRLTLPAGPFPNGSAVFGRSPDTWPVATDRVPSLGSLGSSQ